LSISKQYGVKIIVNISKQYQQRIKEKGTQVDNQKLGITILKNFHGIHLLRLSKHNINNLSSTSTTERASYCNPQMTIPEKVKYLISKDYLKPRPC
jgi:mevalonate pyrophosphate decarboxylase